MKSSLIAILVGGFLLVGGPQPGGAVLGPTGPPGIAGHSEIRGRVSGTLRPRRRFAPHHSFRHQRKFRDRGSAVDLLPESDQAVSAAPPEIYQEILPAPVEQAPPAPPQPSYYWYACGSGEAGAASRQPASSFCLGGVGPSVRGLPSPGKPAGQFLAEEATCRARASTEAGTLPGVAVSGTTDSSLASADTMQERYDIGYTRCMQAKGNQVAVATTFPRPYYPPSPGLPYAPSPPRPGTLAPAP